MPATFLAATLPSASNWRKVAYGNGTFVAIAYATGAATGDAATSPDGITWTARTIPGSSEWGALCFGNGVFVALNKTKTEAAVSADGITWTIHTTPIIKAWRSLAYGAGLFVAMADTSVADYMTSPDGVTWTARTLPTSGICYALAFGGGLFVAMRYFSSTYYTSADGTTWTSRSFGSSKAWMSICYGDGKFLAVINDALPASYTSPDGITWTSTSMIDNYWRGAAYGASQFVCVAQDSFIGTSSANSAVTWETFTLPSAPSYQDITFGDGTFVAVSASTTTAAYFTAAATPSAIASASTPLGTPAVLALQPPFARISVPGPLGAPAALAVHDFTGLLGDPITRWVMDLITPTGTVRVPISSWQATLQSGSSSYVQCVIPACLAWVDAINTATEFVIYRRADVPGTALVIEYEMARSAAEYAQFDRGPQRYTCTLSGYPSAFADSLDPPAVYDRTLAGVRSNSSGSKLRVRCAIDWLLRPGHRAYVGAVPLIVRYINYYAMERDAYMDVGE